MYSKGILCQCQGIFYASHEPTGTLCHKNFTQVDFYLNFSCCIYVPQLNVIYNVISDWRRSNTIRETTQALFVLFPMLLPVANAGKNSTHLFTQVLRFSFPSVPNFQRNYIWLDIVCSLQVLYVYEGSRYLGKAIQYPTCFLPHIEVWDEKDNKLYDVNGPCLVCCSDTEYPVKNV